MKNKFKFLMVAALAAVSIPVVAQNSYQSVTAVTLATCTASTATNIAVVLDVRQQNKVEIQLEAYHTSAGAVTLTLPYQRSVDGVTYETALTSLALSVNGVTKQTVVTNITVNNAGWIKFPYMTNASAINTTNFALRYGLIRGGSK